MSAQDNVERLFALNATLSARCAELERALDRLIDASGNCGESGYGGPEPTPWDIARAAIAAAGVQS